MWYDNSTVQDHQSHQDSKERALTIDRGVTQAQIIYPVYPDSLAGGTVERAVTAGRREVGKRGGSVTYQSGELCACLLVCVVMCSVTYKHLYFISTSLYICFHMIYICYFVM